MKWEPLLDPSSSAVATTANQTGPYETICLGSGKKSASFKYLQNFFPELSEAKFTAVVFVGPHVDKKTPGSQGISQEDKKEDW